MVRINPRDTWSKTKRKGIKSERTQTVVVINRAREKPIVAKITARDRSRACTSLEKPG